MTDNKITEKKIAFIFKRDGKKVQYDKNKIAEAIFKAARSVGGTDKKTSEKLALEVESIILSLPKDIVPTVEQIQDVVEKVLINNGHAKTAKAYILYRHQRTKRRQVHNTFIDVHKSIDEYLFREDWRVRENSNTDYSFSGLMLHTAGKMIATYVLNEVYPTTVAKAHNEGYFHIHDLSAGIIGYCAGWGMQRLLLDGFGGVPNKAECKPAKHMDTVVHQMVNFIGCLQMEFAGAQAFSSVDTYLAPFIRADNLSFKEVKQNIQRMVFGLNIPSRWGSQTPFSNLTFDWVVPEDLKDTPVIIGGKIENTTYGDYQKEMDILNKAFLEVMKEGDADGRIFTFPIPTYNMTEDFDWDSPNADLLFEVTSKYGTPYFQNYIGSNLNPSSVRAMCCRLNLNLDELQNRPGSIWAPGDSTGSIGVVTINMNRLGYEAKTEEEFFDKLDYLMDLARDSLEIKRKLIDKNMKNGLVPYTKVYLGTFKNHFSTIGLLGMNESCINFLGEDIASENGLKFTQKVLLHMREKMKVYQKETGNLYNLEASPAEGASYRLARFDRKMYPEIHTSGTKSVPFLTNSTQLPVDYTDDIILALEHQNEIQHLYTGGTIMHVFLGERLSSGEAAKNLVRKIAYNTRLPYFSLTPTFSICKSDGYISGEHSDCPTCGKKTEIYSRVVGYFRPVQNWNDGKRMEFKNRVTFNEKVSDFRVKQVLRPSKEEVEKRTISS